MSTAPLRPPIELAHARLLHTELYIGGAWLKGQAVYPVRNPATGEVIVAVARAGAAEAQAAVEAARKAFPAWRAQLAAERGRIVRRWGDLMMAHQRDLAVLMSTEQGKPLAEAMREVVYAASFLFWFAEEARRVYGELIPSHKAGSRIVVSKEPIGVMAAITPWNFPLAMVTRKLGPAIAAGCTAVLKPSEETPLSALALATLAEEVGLPPGVLNVISGDAPAIGSAWMASPAVRAVSFTGSTRVGKLLMKQAADTVKRVALELGGNAPFLVFDDADLDAALAGAMASKFRNTGQTCVCVNRFLVQDGIYQAFTQKLAEAVRKLKVASALEPGAEQGPLINAAALKKVEIHVADAQAKGARVLCGGARHARGGTFYQPTVLTEVDTRMQLAREETFGPVAACFRFKTEAEAVALANDTEYGLSAYCYTRDLGRAWRMAEALEVGILGINEGIISTEVAPFGGVKESGLGREGSRHGMEEYLETKYVLMGGLAA